MHLISQCFTVGFPCHPRKQKSLAAKRNCFEGHHGDQLKTSLGLCACLGQAMPMLHTPDPRGAIPWLGTGDIGISALLMHAFFSTWCTASVSPCQLPAPCIMQAFCSVRPACFQLFVLPYVYFRGLAGEDRFTPIKLMNCQGEQDTVLVTGITVDLLTWHQEGKEEGW